MGDNETQPITYKVYFTRRCEKRFGKLTRFQQESISKTIENLRGNPRIGYSLKDPVLKDLYSVHAGDFRIVYKFLDNPAEIELWAIELRKHVYDELMRFRGAKALAARIELKLFS